MKKATLFAVLCLASAPAFSEPVYLLCHLTTGQKVVDWNITLDEANQNASYTIPELNVVNKVPAVFSADRVIFDSMQIDRTNLTFKRDIDVAGIVRHDAGQCEIQRPANRKF